MCDICANRMAQVNAKLVPKKKKKLRGNEEGENQYDGIGKLNGKGERSVGGEDIMTHDYQMYLK